MSNIKLEGVLSMSRTIKGRGWSLVDQPLFFLAYLGI